jgi:hypothetical protein
MQIILEQNSVFPLKAMVYFVSLINLFVHFGYFKTLPVLKLYSVRWQDY